MASTAALSQNGTPDPGAIRFRSIVVDASRVARLGSPSTATAIQGQLGRDAAEVFADRMTPGDPRAAQLVIRIDSIKLSSYVGGSSFAMGDSSTMDFLEGAGLVTSGGRVISTTPMLSALDASYSGAWTLPDIDQRRVASITHQFAYWLRREMGL